MNCLSDRLVVGGADPGVAAPLSENPPQGNDEAAELQRD
jgi:hypothetical protein